MKLNYKITGEGKSLVILHGLFGSMDNWQTLARRWADYFEVISVDQRNHGRSERDPEMGYRQMAGDLNNLLIDLGKDKVAVLGHSMGGKTAMQFAIDFPEKTTKLFVIDIAPKYYPPHHENVLAGLRRVDLVNTRSRQEAEQQMAEVISEPVVRQFLLKNLYRIQKDRFAWRMNLSAIEENIQAINAAVPSDRSNVPAVFVRGKLSDYINDLDEISIKEQFIHAEFVHLSAGHWVHAELQEEIYNLILMKLLE